ncbi:MAG: MBL fold metallo-hydrolase, partial [Gemmatimonadales bacterium]|nr:MBL fold metallo-hydrolase [Gemmatimonadales bacterium]
SKYLDAALDAFIERTDVVIAQHHWPSWGRERARRFIIEQRDLYRVMHDQCLRLMSHGLTPNEIAAEFRMPASLEGRWHARPYYGAIAHNLRAVYAHYMGPYDGHPASLDPLPPVPAANKMLEYMGGAEAVLERARRDFDAGEYRWVVEVGRHLVFADPANRAARELVADAMEQLGYQSESSTWRNAYLLGAKELRFGAPKPGPGAIISRKAVSMLPMEMFFDYLAIRVNADKAEGLQLRLDWRMIDEGSSHRLTLSHSALSHLPGSHGAQAMATISTDREALATIVASGRPLAETPDSGLLAMGGDAGAVRRLFATFDEFPPNFAILEP